MADALTRPKKKKERINPYVELGKMIGSIPGQFEVFPSANPFAPMIVPKAMMKLRPKTPAQDTAGAIVNPAEEIAQDFAGTDESEFDVGIDMEFGGGEAGEGGGEFPLLETPDPQITAGQIPGMFGGLLGEVQNQPAPIGRPVPEALDTTKTFLATLAGTLGTQLTRNPAVLQDIQERMAERQRRSQAIEDQNYAEQLLFGKEKFNRLLALRGNILEKQIETALSQGNEEGARVAAENLERIRQRGRIEAEKEAGRQARLTEGTKARLEAKAKEKEGAELKPLTMDQFNQAVKDIATSDPEKLTEIMADKVNTGWFGLGGKKPASSKQEALEQIYAGAALGGEPAVAALGKVRLVNSIKQRLRIPEKLPSNPEAQRRIITRLANELSKYGISLTE